MFTSRFSFLLQLKRPKKTTFQIRLHMKCFYLQVVLCTKPNAFHLYITFPTMWNNGGNQNRIAAELSAYLQL